VRKGLSVVCVAGGGGGNVKSKRPVGRADAGLKNQTPEGRWGGGETEGGVKEHRNGSK